MDENIIQQIKDLSKQISFQSENFELEDHKNSFVLEDKDNNLHTVVPIEVLTKCLIALKDAREENFKLKLEKAIWKYVPIDFGDTWTVVMNELENGPYKSKKLSEINLNSLVKNVKLKYPNLFLNMDDFLPSNIAEIRNIG